MATHDTVQLPEPFASIPREVLTFGPSPIQHLPRISQALGGKVKVYAKREDCNSGLAYGGNKTRKLEYLIPEALSQGCDTLISIGGIQSNHTRQVAAVGAKLGLSVSLIQENWIDTSSDSSSKTVQHIGHDTLGNIQLSRLMSADVRVASAHSRSSPQDQGQEVVTFGIEHKQSLANLRQELIESGKKPYYIPAGASDHPLGGLGFARWAFEVEAQEKELGIFFDTVIVCAVTGSTFAGMIAGFKLAQKLGSRKDRKVIGIDASAKVQETFDQVLRIARQTGSKIGLEEGDISEEDVILDGRYHGGAYGVPDQRTLEAIKFGAETEAFITDPVYEGKSLAGMVDLIRTGEIKDGSCVLYAHMGGQLALNAYSGWGM